jgi:enoyl-CoA hydratase
MRVEPALLNTYSSFSRKGEDVAEYPKYEHILYEVDRGRARITLNQPKRRNALSNAMLTEFAQALWEADDDRDVHCVIIRASGPAFCAGYDLAQTPPPPRTDGIKRRTGAGIEDDAWMIESSQRKLRVLWEMHKPSIAQIHGACLAGGTDLALYCDVLIAADDARIGFPPLRNMGAPPNHMWLYNCGPQWTKRLLLTGDTVSGEDAAKIGLVMKSVPPEHLEAEVEGLADRFALVDPALLSANKRIVNLGLELMGAQTLQRVAAENDARAHTAPAARQLFKDLGTKGLKQALADRDAPFGDGRARVVGPELRDADGRLLPETD